MNKTKLLSRVSFCFHRADRVSSSYASSDCADFGSVTMVPVRFTPTFDPAKVAMRPAGFVEKNPSQTEHDSSARSLALQGYTQEQIDQVWQKATMHGDKASADQRWRELNQKN